MSRRCARLNVPLELSMCRPSDRLRALQSPSINVQQLWDRNQARELRSFRCITFIFPPCMGIYEASRSLNLWVRWRATRAQTSSPSVSPPPKGPMHPANLYCQSPSRSHSLRRPPMRLYTMSVLLHTLRFASSGR